MSSSEQGPEILPQVIHLSDLLKWIREGRVRIPNFQRDFVWDRRRMLDLFDSIRKQYPIGTLLFWRPTRPRPMRDRMGPLTLPDTDAPKLLVLDGQQRLTTLAGALLRGEPALGDRRPDDDPDPRRWEICFDASEKDGGVFVHPDPRTDRPVSYVSLPEMLKTRGILEASRRMLDAPDGGSTDLWVEQLEGAAQALQSYRIPVVEFVTDSLQLAVESFTRLNRQGRPVGPDEMFSALTYEAEDGAGERFNLSRHIDRLLRDIEQRDFGAVDRVVVLRAVLAAADLDPYRTEWDRLGRELRIKTRRKLPDAVDEARRGLLASIDFLRSEHIHNIRMLPYSMQLVALSAFFGRCVGTPTAGQRRLLQRYLWVTAFAGWFGRGNPARIRKLIEELRDRVAKEPDPGALETLDLDTPADPFPSRHDLRSARVRALLCAILQNGLQNPEGQVLDNQELADRMLTRGPSAFSTICASVEDSALRASPANRIFDVAPKVKGQARNWLTELPPESRDPVLVSHHIDPDSYGLLESRQHDEFLRRRQSRLISVERDFMDEKGVRPPDTDEPDRPAIDVEDEVLFDDYEE